MAFVEEKLAFLDLLIKASENGADLTDDDIREEVDLVMFAGHDTTASAMTWFLYCIARHPEQQVFENSLIFIEIHYLFTHSFVLYKKLLMEEVDQVFGDSDRLCTNQDVTELIYLECCIKETLRLYPSVPAVMRRLTEDVVIGQ